MNTQNNILNKIDKFSTINDFGYSVVHNSSFERVKYIQINTLEDYISHMTKAMTSYYELAFRGEPDFYDSTVASIFRTKSPLRTPNFLKREYFKEIGHTLNQIERDNFLSYSQHHGLPTELLDVTTSPLYALYFACSQPSISNLGVVNIINTEQSINLNDLVPNNLDFDSSQLLDLSEMVYNYYIQNNVADNKLLKVLPLFLSKNSNYAKYLLGELVVYINDLQKYSNSVVMDSMTTRELNILNTLQELEYEYLEYDTLYDFGNTVIQKIQRMEEISPKKYIEMITFEYYEYNVSLIKVYLELYGLAYTLFETILSDMSTQSLNSPVFKEFLSKITIPPFPLVKYSSSVKFDRIKAQDGTFIYQCYHLAKKMITIDGEESKRDTKIFLFPQVINSNIKMIIMDKKKILNQLDFMGINKKLIYPDNDNIAQYIKEKYI